MGGWDSLYIEYSSFDVNLEAVISTKSPIFWTHTGISTTVCGIVLGLEFTHSREAVRRNLRPGSLMIDTGGPISSGHRAPQREVILTCTTSWQTHGRSHHGD
jgi:hypothetical protein